MQLLQGSHKIGLEARVRGASYITVVCLIILKLSTADLSLSLSLGHALLCVLLP